MEELLNSINAILWGPPTLILLFIVGLLFQSGRVFFKSGDWGIYLGRLLAKYLKELTEKIIPMKGR